MSQFAFLQRKWSAEVPVELVRADGQVLHGRIDLLVKVKDGWILLDHKANPQGAARREALVQEYSAQLAKVDFTGSSALPGLTPPGYQLSRFQRWEPGR